MCPRLWKIIVSSKKGLEAARREVASLDVCFEDSLGTETSFNPLERLCISSPSLANAKTLVVAYTVYHTLKREHLNSVVACDSYVPLFELPVEIARAAILKHFSSKARRAMEATAIRASEVQLTGEQAVPDAGEAAPVTPIIATFPATPEWARH